MPRKKATSKRANNEGSVYKNKRGLWVAQATIGYDENGKQIRKAVSGKTRAEAIANLAPYLPKNGARRQLIQQDMSLQKHMQFWLMKYKKRTIAARTFERYVVNAKRYIYPHMGDYLPQNITTNFHHCKLFIDVNYKEKTHNLHNKQIMLINRILFMTIIK